MLDEKKGTCCHKCGHVHVKGTSCPKPFLRGERSCARRALEEATTTNHYQDRKRERGTIQSIELPDYVYGDRNKDEINQNLIKIIQSKLNQRLDYVEKMDLGMSNNINLGLVVFMPLLSYKDKVLPIKMDSGNGQGVYYLVIAANNTLITMYPTSKKIADLEQDVKRHVEAEKPEDVRPPKADTLSGYQFKIDIDGNEMKEKEEKPEIQKTSEESLDYKVRTDYRVGATFDHKQYGPGKIVAAAGGGKAGTSGVVDWIDVKYPKPYMKGGKLQDTRRFPSIYTSAYFGKTLKEMSLQNPGAEELVRYLDKHPDIRQTLGFASTEGVRDYIETLNARGWYDFVEEVEKAKKELDETDTYCPSCLKEYLLEYKDKIEEAEYRGRKVKLGKPFLTPGGPKKRSVYVKNKKGNVIKVNFGDPNLKIKKNIPARRKSFRARHKCHTAKDRTTPRYWSCKAW